MLTAGRHAIGERTHEMSARDPEAHLPSRGLRRDLHGVHPRKLRAPAAPREDLLDVEVGSFEDRLYSTIGPVPDPSRESEGPSLTSAGRPVEHPLHPSRDHDANPFHEGGW